MAESVLAGEGATFSEDQLLFLRRHGYLEETYWTFSYSPIQDESGGIGGVFVAVSDTTTRVVGERRLQVLRDLGELSTVSVGTAEEASRAVVGVLARHRAEVPFVAAYLRSPDGSLRLVAAHGVTVGSAVAPRTLHGPADGGPVWRVAGTGAAEVVRGFVDGAVDAVDACVAGPAAPTDAVVLPVVVAGRVEPAGVLVAGVNPYRELDADHRSFFDLVADQLATAVTDALAYEAERRRAEALAELDRAKTDFFSNVSHEFRTPLTLIMGPVAELRAAPAVAADPRLRQELDVIHRNALRLGKLVNSLLDFSRLEAGRVEAHFEPVDLAAFTAELASVFRSAVERAGIDSWSTSRRCRSRCSSTGTCGRRSSSTCCPTPSSSPSRAGSPSRCARRSGRRCSPSPTPAPACRLTRCRACSSGSTGWSGRRRGRVRAAGSGWPWCAS